MPETKLQEARLNSFQEDPGSPLHKAANGKPKLQWRIEDAGDARTRRYPLRKAGDMD